MCTRTIDHCLQMGGKHAEADHLRTMMNCAEMCRTCAGFMLRGSALHPRTCGVCAEACRRCAEECERMADDQMMQECAATCRRCAESCGRMAEAA